MHALNGGNGGRGTTPTQRLVRASEIALVEALLNGNGKYVSLALDCLAHVDPQQAAHRAAEIVANGGSHPAAEVIKAASIRWAAKSEIPQGLTELILDDLAEVF